MGEFLNLSVTIPFTFIYFNMKSGKVGIMENGELKFRADLKNKQEHLTWRQENEPESVEFYKSFNLNEYLLSTNTHLAIMELYDSLIEDRNRKVIALGPTLFAINCGNIWG